MEFLRKIMTEMGFEMKLELAKAMGKTPGGFYSLERATDRISLRDLIALRHLTGMTDSHLLDLLEEEATLETKTTRRPMPKRRET